mgnify:CR=1 FL=1
MLDLPGVNQMGNQNTTGNAATATALQNIITIGGISFDGTSNIDLPGVNHQGNQHTTGNAASATALQNSRTIGGVSFDGTANIDLPGVNIGGNQNTTGEAGSVTNGVYTIGNQTIAGVKTFSSTINGNISGNAATANTSGSTTYAATSNELNSNNWKISAYYRSNNPNYVMELVPNIEESRLYGYGKQVEMRAGYYGLYLAYYSPNLRGNSFVTLHNNLTIDSQTGANSGSTMGHLDLKAGNNIRYYSPLVNTSDNRLKHNEVNIVNALNTIRQLKPQKYQKTREMYAEDYNGDISGYYNIESGFIAQDVLNINDLSYTVFGGNYIDESGNNIEQQYFISYNDIFTYNVAATKELDSIVQSQQTEINNLKTENTLLKSKLNELLEIAGKETI